LYCFWGRDEVHLVQTIVLKLILAVRLKVLELFGDLNGHRRHFTSIDNLVKVLLLGNSFLSEIWQRVLDRLYSD
jgi:hypothetical protein